MFRALQLDVHESDVALFILVRGREIGPVPRVAVGGEACPPLAARPERLGFLVDEFLRAESSPSVRAA